MNYVEWLRIRNTLRAVVIILGILVALAVVLRVSVARYMSPEAWISNMSLERGTKVMHSVLPDGTKRIVIDNPTDRTHVVIDDRGASGKHIVLTEPSANAHKESGDMHVGSIVVSQTPHGSMTTTTFDTNGAVPMLYYMALADIVALIVATILAAPFARQIDGHLEVALATPCPRWRYALGAIGVNVAGIVAASFLTVIAFYVCQLLFETPRLDFSGVNARAIAMGVVFPLAWYAMLCAATTWLNRSYGAVLGFAWPVVILVGILAVIHPGNVIGLFLHDVAWVISRLDPLSYVSVASPNADATVNYSASNFPLRFSIEILLFVVYGALAVWQWQRVEA